MKTQKLLRRLTLVGALVSGLTSAVLAASNDSQFKPLFNGKDLSGWEGNPDLWSVKDGAITGQTTKEHPAKGNTFLIWKGGNVDDFELRFSYRIVANNDKGFANSGVQYRSKIVNPESWVVGGYQADFEAGTTYSGILYDEANVAGGRGIMAARGEKVVWDQDCKKQVAGSVGKSEDIQAAIKKEDWNEYVVTAKGHHFVHQINGRTTVDVTDDCEAKRLVSGVLALQLHAGEPMTVQFKKIELRPLSAKPTAKSDLDQLQGEWVPAEMIANGSRVETDTLAGMNLKIKGNDYVWQTSDSQVQGAFKIAETANPKSMDVSPQSGNPVTAIYEVSSDSFKACYAFNGAPRPAAFKSTEGSDYVLVVYKRK